MNISLSGNENPYGPSPSAIAAAIGSAHRSNRYQDDAVAELTNAIACLHDVSEQQVLLGPGSSALLYAATSAHVSRERPLVVAAPTFELPQHIARRNGGGVLPVVVDDDGRPDLDAMLIKAPRAGMVYVCNPNNPTGHACSRQSVARLVGGMGRSGPLLVLDEAYIDYADDAGDCTAIPLVTANHRVIVCRTFSKIHGLAALRIGYAVGHPSALAPLRSQLSERAISGPAAAAALAALSDRSNVDRQRHDNSAAREYTRRRFVEAGYRVLPSEANFVMIRCGHDAAEVGARCSAAGVIVARPFPPLTTHVRISIGTQDEMRKATDTVLAILSELDARKR